MITVRVGMRWIADILSASGLSPLTSLERLAWKGYALRAGGAWQRSAFTLKAPSENDSSHSLSAYCLNIKTFRRQSDRSASQILCACSLCSYFLQSRI